MKLTSAIIGVGLAVTASVGGQPTQTVSPTAISRPTAATGRSTLTPTPPAGTSRATPIKATRSSTRLGRQTVAAPTGFTATMSCGARITAGSTSITAPPSAPPEFIAQDGDFQNSPIKQDIHGLHLGKTYTVGFDYAYGQQYAFDGDTQQNWAVSLGGSAAQYTPTMTNPSQASPAGFRTASASWRKPRPRPCPSSPMAACRCRPSRCSRA